MNNLKCEACGAPLMLNVVKVGGIGKLELEYDHDFIKPSMKVSQDNDHSDLVVVMEFKCSQFCGKDNSKVIKVSALDTEIYNSEYKMEIIKDE